MQKLLTSQQIKKQKGGWEEPSVLKDLVGLERCAWGATGGDEQDTNLDLGSEFSQGC